MTFPVMGGGFNASAPAFPVQRSVRLRSAAPAYFNRTPASVPTSYRKTTISFWAKNIHKSDGDYTTIYSTGDYNLGTPTSRYGASIYFVGGKLYITEYAAGTTRLYRESNALFRDPSSWYHFVISIDTTLPQGNGQCIVWCNNELLSWTTTINPTQNTDLQFQSNIVSYIGASSFTNPASKARFLDGYITEFNLIDGQALTTTSFGSYNIGTGVWQPLPFTGTYGTNGYYLNFQDNSGQTTSSNVGIGKDSSGNGNYWVSNGITLTPTTSASYDSMLDVPTNTSPTNANFCTANAVNALNWLSQNGSMTYAGGNLNYSIPVQGAMGGGTIGVSSGKWYWEYVGSSNYAFYGILSTRVIPTGGGTYYYYQANGGVYNYPYNSTSQTLLTTVATSNSTDVIGIALNMDSLTMAIYKNNILLYTVTGIVADTYVPLIGGAATSTGGSVNFGQRPFSYPLAGYNMLCTYNLPTPTIPNGAAYFAATTYSGSNATQVVTNTTNNPLVAPYSNNPNAVPLQPDFIWIKDRNSARDHRAMDSVRGIDNVLTVNSTGVAYNGSALSSINSDGFTLNTADNQNLTGETYVGWQWKGGGTAVTNTAGSISSQVSANTTAGFSVVTYTGTGTNNPTVGHGLNDVPAMIILKDRDSNTTDNNWWVYHKSLSANNYILLNTTGQATSGALNGWIGTSPSLTTFTLAAGSTSSNNQNESGDRFVAYCWAEKPGFSKFGTYVGNTTTLPFVYLGFRPRFIMIKGSTFTSNWFIQDTSRGTYNVINGLALRPNLPNIEDGTTTYNIDILSNGFKLRSTAADANTSGATFIYAAFAENPFNYSLAR